MGSSPANKVKETKWAVQISYRDNGHRSSTTLKGLDAPTESEVIKALYKRCGNNRNMEFTEIEIYNKWTYEE